MNNARNNVESIFDKVLHAVMTTMLDRAFDESPRRLTETEENPLECFVICLCLAAVSQRLFTRLQHFSLKSGSPRGGR